MNTTITDGVEVCDVCDLFVGACQCSYAITGRVASLRAEASRMRTELREIRKTSANDARCDHCQWTHLVALTALCLGPGTRVCGKCSECNPNIKQQTKDKT